MRFISIRDLRNQPGRVWKELERGDLVLTSNGKPVGVLVGVEQTELARTLATLRRVRAQLAVSRMRKRAADGGLDRLSPEQVDREVKATRRLRKRA